MKLESLTNNEGDKTKSKSPPRVPDVIENNYTTFEKGDKVILKSNASKYSSDLKHIVGVELTVIKCYTRDLGDGVLAEILYLKGGNVQNPYLADHFKRVV